MEGKTTRDNIDAAFDALKGYCKDIGATCNNCRFLGEEGFCIFGTIAPWEWKMPKETER